MNDLFADTPGDDRRGRGEPDEPAEYGASGYDEYSDFEDYVEYEDDDGYDDRHPLAVAAPASRRRRWVGVVVLLVTLGLVGGAAVFGYDQVRPLLTMLNDSGDYPGPGSGEVQVVISEGDSGRRIGQTLEEAGVVKSAGAFVSALGKSGANNAMQPGTYTMKREMSAAGAVALLQNPQSRVNVTVRVREGLWKNEVFDLIGEQTGFTRAQLAAAAQDPRAGLPSEAKGDPEGYLFPATYTFNPDVTPVQIVQQMVAKYTEEMNTAGVPEAERRRVLIVASLVQAEAYKPEDFAKVARVVENRLVKEPNLGIDSTVNFALQKRGLTLTQSDLNVDSPYNTRRHPGLPPGPINSPGAAAIEATVSPAQGDWLYFVTVNPDTGETVFTSDYNHFLREKERYNKWLAENPNS